MTDPLVISSSQLDTFADCERKWWLSKVERLPEVPRGYLTLGTVLHACLERWCSADENGRVPYDGTSRPLTEGPLTGQTPGDPVEVFPKGWETVEGQTVTPNEAALIRRLVEQAVERGIISRGDGRVLERELRLPVIEGVELVGFVDVFVPNDWNSSGSTDTVAQDIPQVHDHKTFGEGSVRFLAQPNADSPNYLGKNRQLLTYAAATSIEDGWDGPVVVRHNQFPKFEDGRGPRVVEAVVRPEDWAARWEAIQHGAARMLVVRKIKRWDDVPGPYGSDACSKYGGCPFREICGRRSTLEGYRGIVRRQIEARGSPRPNIPTADRRGTKEMSSDDIFARARRPAQPQQKAQAQQGGGVVPGGAVTSSQAAPSSAPVATAPGINGGAPPAPAAPTPPVNAPPWANPACTACRGTGFNSKGHACPICDALAKRQKRPTSSMYLVQGSLADGFTASGRPEKAKDLEALGAPVMWASRSGNPKPDPTEAQIQARVSEIAASDAAQAAAGVAVRSTYQLEPASTTGTMSVSGSAPLGFEATAVEVATAIDKVDEKAKRGRKPAGVTILIGCAQLKGPDRPTMHAQELLARLGAELAKDMGAESYWALDAFKRRDRIKARSAEIAESLGTTILMVAGVRDPDVDSLVSSLLPHASTVVEGLR